MDKMAKMAKIRKQQKWPKLSEKPETANWSK